MTDTSFPRFLYQMEEAVHVRCSTRPNYRLRHSHSFFEFSYVALGQGNESIDHRTFALRPGYFSVVSPTQTHQLQFDISQPALYYYVAVSLENFSGAGSLSLDLPGLVLASPLSGFPVYFSDPLDVEHLNQLFASLWEEYQNRPPYWESLLKAKISEALILFYRRTTTESPQQRPSGLMAEVLAFVTSHYQQDLTVAQVAQHFGLTPAYLGTLFRRATGRSLVTMVRDLRLKHACSLLAATDLPVIHVSVECGFRSYRNFVRIFGSTYGETPQAYRYRQRV